MKNLRRPWTAQKETRLRSLIDAGVPASIAAVKLKSGQKPEEHPSFKSEANARRPPTAGLKSRRHSGLSANLCEFMSSRLVVPQFLAFEPLKEIN